MKPVVLTRSTPGAVSSSRGISPDPDSRAMACSLRLTTAAGASTTRSTCLDAATMISSAKVVCQSIVVSTVAVRPSSTSIPVSERVSPPRPRVSE